MTETFYLLLKENPYIILVISLVLDSIPILGVIIPDGIILAIVGFVLSETGRNPLEAVSIATIALVLTQLLMYLIGRKYKDPVKGFALRNKDAYNKIEEYMGKNDFLMNVSFRLTSTIHSTFALVSGIRDYPIFRFLLYEIPITFIRTGLYISAGYYVAKSLSDIESVSSQIGSIFIWIVIGSIILSIITSRKILRSSSKR